MITTFNLQFHDDSMESNEALENRGKTFLRERIEEILVLGRRDANILVTSHGGLIRAMVLYLKKNAQTDNLPEIKKLYEMWPKNVGVSKFKITVDKVTHQVRPLTKYFFCLLLEKNTLA